MDYGYSIINHNYSSSLQEESSKTFLNIRTSLFKKFPNLITIAQKIYSYLHSSKKLINKYSISIILQKEKKEEKNQANTTKVCFSFISADIEASIDKQEAAPGSARGIRATNRPTMEHPISRYRFDETSKTAMRFIAVEVNPRQRRRGSFFIIPR